MTNEQITKLTGTLQGIGMSDAQIQATISSAIATEERDAAKAELDAMETAFRAAQERAKKCGLIVPEARPTGTRRIVSDLPRTMRELRDSGLCPCGCNAQRGNGQLGFRPGHDARNGGHIERQRQIELEREAK